MRGVGGGWELHIVVGSLAEDYQRRSNYGLYDDELLKGSAA